MVKNDHFKTSVHRQSTDVFSSEDSLHLLKLDQRSLKGCKLQPAIIRKQAIIRKRHISLHSKKWFGLNKPAIDNLKGTIWGCILKTVEDYLRLHSFLVRTIWACIQNFWFEYRVETESRLQDDNGLDLKLTQDYRPKQFVT